MSVRLIIRPGFSEAVFWAVSGTTGLMHNSLFPIEAALLEALFGMVDPPLASQLRSQFAFYNHFDRGGEWRRFEMRRVIWGKVNFPTDLKIETKKTNARIASLKFRTRGCPSPNWAVFHLVRGRFFCIEFGTCYKPIRFENEIDPLVFKPNRELAQLVKSGGSH